MSSKQQRISYSQTFLQAEEQVGAKGEKDEYKSTGSQLYLEECSHSVDLGLLYEMQEEHGTCAYNEQMEYTPVQVRVSPHIAALHGGAQYLLQVWDTSGRKRLQERLSKPITRWAICFNYFIFKTEEGDKDSEYFQIHNMDKNACKTFIKADFLDESYKYLVYNSNKFYAANDERIKIFSVKLTSMEKTANPVKRFVESKDAAEIQLYDKVKKTGHRIHGLAVTSDGRETSKQNSRVPGKKPKTLPKNDAINEFGDDFIQVYIEIEKQNKISINELRIKNGCLPPYEFEYKFIEWREYIHRAPLNDPIEKYQFVFNKDNKHAGVAKRQSGAFDIYYNGNFIDMAVSSNDGKPIKCANFTVTYDRMIFDMQKGKNKYRVLNHNQAFANSKKLTGKVLTENLFFTERIKNSAKLFAGILLIETNVFVAHGRHLSMFYLKNQKFNLGKVLPGDKQEDKQHFSFRSYIRFIFKRLHIDKKTNREIFSVGVLLENGEIHVLDSETPSEYQSWGLNSISHNNGFKIPGDVLTCCGDPVQFRCNLFLSLEVKEAIKRDESEVDLANYGKDNGMDGNEVADLNQPKPTQRSSSQTQDDLNQIKTVAELAAERKDISTQVRAYIFNDKLYDVTEQLLDQGVADLRREDQLVGMFEEAGMQSHFIYFQKHSGKLYLFAVEFGSATKGNGKFKKSKTMANAGIARTLLGESTPIDTEASAQQDIKVLKVDQMMFKCERQISKFFDRELDGNRQVWEDADPKKLVITSAVITSEHLLIFTKHNCYKVGKNKNGKFGQHQVQLIPEISWKNFFISSMKYVYLINDKDTHQSGLSFFDLARIFDDTKEFGKKYQDLTMWLQFAQVGICSAIDYGSKIERIAYLKSYSEIVLIPTLHLNQVTFIGQKQFEKYIAVKREKDLFYALSNDRDPDQPLHKHQPNPKNQKNIDKKGLLQNPRRLRTYLATWDIVTGKMLSEQLTKNDYSGFESFKSNDINMFMSGLYEKSLLVSKEPLPKDETMLAQYFDQEMLQSKFQNQTTYVKSPNDEKEFHEFRIIEITDSRRVKEIYQFIHPKYKEQQYLYLNSRADLLIEWLSHNRVLLYEKQEIKSSNGIMGNQEEAGLANTNPSIRIKWKLVRRMEHLRKNYGRIDFLEHVSPDFSLYIDVDLAAEKYLIRAMATEEILHKIPNYLMRYDKKDPAASFLKFKWVGNDMFKVLNNAGMEKLVDIGTEFKQQQFNQTSNYDEDVEKYRNFFTNRAPLKTTEVLKRLIRKTQAYKSAKFMFPVEQPFEELRLYDHIFTVDFAAANQLTKKYFSDLSFSYLSWRTIEMLEARELSIDDISDEQAIEHITFSILPGGLTVFHKLYAQSNVIERILQNALNNVGNDTDCSDIKYSFPYLADLTGECAIDLCVKNEALKTLNIFLKYLAGQGIDHHSRRISKFLPKMLQLELPNFVDYMLSRSKQTEQIVEITRKTLNESYKTVGIMSTDYWTTQEHIEATLFTDSLKGQDIACYYMDVVGIHEFGDEGYEFFLTLAETGMLDIFDIPLVQKLILFKWPIIKDTIMNWLLYPFLGSLLSTCYYTTFMFHDEINGRTATSSWIAEAVVKESMVVFSLYFLGLELLQVKTEGLGYFAAIWNFVDIVPPILQLSIAFMVWQGKLEDFSMNEEVGAANRATLSIMLSLASLGLWFRFLYFLRIFDSTGFLIRAILAVVVDMRYFMLILGITIVAFGDSFKVMSSANDDANEFMPEPKGLLGGVYYAYLIGLGEFNFDYTKNVGSKYCLILFIINTIFMTIIMLNLFIAIISESFDKVNSQGQKASFREKAGLIAENQFLLSMESKMNWCEKNKYLLYVQALGQDENEDPEQVKNRLLIQDQSAKMEKQVAESQREIIRQIKRMGDELKEQVVGQKAEDEGKEFTSLEGFGQEASPMRHKPLRQLVLQIADVSISTSDDDKQIGDPKKAAKASRQQRTLASGLSNLVKKMKPEDYKSQENPYKVLGNSQNEHDKWVVLDTRSAWIEFTFATPISIRAYGLKSANDAPNTNNNKRAPRIWRLTATGDVDATPEVIHEVTSHDHIRWSEAWETQIFLLPGTTDRVVKSLRLDVLSNAGDPHFQLGQFMLFE